MRLLYPSPYRELAARGDVPVRRYRYGDAAASQWAELRLPPGDRPRPAVVILIHGGFWRSAWHADLMNSLAVDLARRGMATWNIEYRRAGMRGGGLPGTMDDAVAACDALLEGAVAERVTGGSVVVVGHSAGGHLALVAARRSRVRPCGVVVLAGITDLRGAAQAGLGGGAVEALMGGGPEHLSRAYTEASPIENLPLAVPVLLVHGTRDQAVPASMSSLYARHAVTAGDEVELAIVRGAGHAELIDPATPAWTGRVVPWIERRIGDPGHAGGRALL